MEDTTKILLLLKMQPSDLTYEDLAFLQLDEMTPEMDEDFAVADLSDLYQEILAEEATLAPGQYLNITDAHLEPTLNGFKLAGTRITNRAPRLGDLDQGLPGHPQLIASGDTYDAFSEIFMTTPSYQNSNGYNQANARRVVVRRPVARATTLAIATRADGHNQANARVVRPVTLAIAASANGHNKSLNANAFNSESDEDNFIRDGILAREAILQPGRALDISEARPGENRFAKRVIGIRLINNPGQRSMLIPIPGHPRLYVRPRSYQRFTELFGVASQENKVDYNQPNGRKPQHGFQPKNPVKSNGCGCGKY